MRTMVIDAETGLDYNFPETGNTPPPVCWSFYPNNDGEVTLRLADSVSNALRHMIKSPEIEIVGQNIGFDLLVAWQWHGVSLDDIFDKLNAGLIKDTAIRQRLLNIANYHHSHGERRVGLDKLVSDYLGLDIAEDKKDPHAWRMRYWELHDVPLAQWPEKARSYAMNDALYTHKIYHMQNEGRRVSPDENFQLKADISLKLMSRHCFKVDQKKTAELRAEHEEIVQAVEPDLKEAGLIWWNPNRFKDHYEKGDPQREGYSTRTKLIRELIEQDCDAQGIKPKRTKTGAVSADSDALRVAQNPVLKLYASVKTSRKLLDTFIPNLERAGEHAIRPYYDVLKKTGRVSASQFPIHQMPRAKGSRECLYGPRRDTHGHVLVAADYDAYEMCSMAQVNYEKFGISTMRDAINEGQDLHVRTAAGLFGYGYDALKKLVDAEAPQEVRLRQGAKAYNFGAPGGMMESTFIRTLSDEDRETILALFPGEQLGSIVRRQLFQWRETWRMGQYFEEVQKKTFGGRTFSYRHPWSKRLRKGLGYSDGLNIQFQGRCADAAKNAMWMLTQDCYRTDGVLRQFDVRILAFIHDEFIFEGPKEGIKEWTSRATQLMIDGASRVIPDVTIRAGAQVMPDHWGKKGIKIEEYIN